jgi:predicted 3-demethylubiquinone-9 3-methyltransferase (glyoxalase superfamily)
MAVLSRISPCLWFDSQAEDAAMFYTSVFDNSRVLRVARYGEAGYEVHGRPAGSVMTVEFQLDGQPFTALNGGPHFRFNEAISFQVACETQDEVDYYWARLAEGGDPAAQQCGWLKDRFGVSWQVVPRVLQALIASGDPRCAERVTSAMLQMKKLDIAGLQQAYEGPEPRR